MAVEKIKLKVHPDHEGFTRFGLNAQTLKSVELTEEVQSYIDNGILVDESYVLAEKKSTDADRADVAVDDESNDNAPKRRGRKTSTSRSDV